MAAPANDIWYAGEPIASATGSSPGTNVEATLDVGPPADEPPITVGTGTASVWYLVYLLEGGGEYTFTVEDATFDVVLDVVFTADAASFTSLGADHSATPSVTCDVAPGGFYLIRVNGFAPSDEGTFTLNWTGPEPPPPAWAAGTACRPWATDRIVPFSSRPYYPMIFPVNDDWLASVSLNYIDAANMAPMVHSLPRHGGLPGESIGGDVFGDGATAFDATCVAKDWVMMAMRHERAGLGGTWVWVLRFLHLGSDGVPTFQITEVDLNDLWEETGAAGALKRAVVCGDGQMAVVTPGSGSSRGMLAYAKVVDGFPSDITTWYGRAYTFALDGGGAPTLVFGPETLVRGPVTAPGVDEVISQDAVLVPLYGDHFSADPIRCLLADLAVGAGAGRHTLNITAIQATGTTGDPTLVVEEFNGDVIEQPLVGVVEYGLTRGINVDTDDGVRPAILTGAWSGPSAGGGNIFGVTEIGFNNPSNYVAHLVSTQGVAQVGLVRIPGAWLSLVSGWLGTEDHRGFLIHLHDDNTYVILREFEFDADGQMTAGCVEQWGTQTADFPYANANFAVWGEGSRAVFQKGTGTLGSHPFPNPPEFLRWHLEPQVIGGWSMG